MLGLGLFKGTIIGIGIGIVTGLALKEVCKMKKMNNQKDKTEYKNDASWVVDLTKYKWKCRILLLNTTCYRDNNYKRCKELYQKYIKDFTKDISNLSQIEKRAQILY